MKRLFAVALLCGACFEPVADNEFGLTPPPGPTSNVTTTTSSATKLSLTSSSGTGGATYEVSAPILPAVLILYQGEGSNYPTTQAGREKLADDSTLTFPFLLDACAPYYPAIKLPGNGVTLTPQQLATNYSEVARCSYERYTAKPYWIPQLVSDVNICGRMLGTGWRLIHEYDIASMTGAEFKFLQDTLQGAGANDFWGSFYNQIVVFTRAGNGALVQGTLQPGVTGSRISPLPIKPGTTMTNHLEAGLALRCIKP